MLRLPRPRPFIQPEKQRAKLANVFMLAVFAPYGFIMALVAFGGIAALFVYAWKVFTANA